MVLTRRDLDVHEESGKQELCCYVRHIRREYFVICYLQELPPFPLMKYCVFRYYHVEVGVARDF